ncbi:MAG: integrase, partial [Gammaproteobacteria bacterium]
MRKRSSNKHLPDRVYIKCGSYYYVDRDAKWIKLGKTLAEAMAKWAAIVEPVYKKIESMSQIFDRYMLEIAPTKAPRT